MYSTALIILALFAIPNSYGAKEIVSCDLKLKIRTNKVGQQPLVSNTKIKLDGENGFTGTRHEFDLTGTKIRCEAAFSGRNYGTFINCWPPGQEFGFKVDRSTLEGKGQSAVPNVLAYASKTTSANIQLICK